MRERERVLLTITCCMVALFIVILFSSSSFISTTYTRMEEDQTRNLVLTLSDLVNQTFADLEKTALDYGVLNNTAKFVQGEYPAYVEEQIQPFSLPGLAVHLMVIEDNNGRILFSYGYDPDSSTKQVTQNELQSYVRLLNTEYLDPFDNKPWHQIFQIVNHTGALVSVPIRYLADERPIGTLIMGRFFNSEWLDETSRIVRHRVSLVSSSSDEGGRFVDFPSGIQVSTINENTIAGRLILQDDLSRSPIIFEVIKPRSMYKQGVSVNNSYLFLFFVLICIFTLLILVVTSRMLNQYTESERQLSDQTQNLRDLTAQKTISDKISALNAVFLSFGTVHDENISHLTSVARRLAEADSVWYYRNEYGKSDLISRYPEDSSRFDDPKIIDLLLQNDESTSDDEINIRSYRFPSSGTDSQTSECSKSFVVCASIPVSSTLKGLLIFSFMSRISQTDLDLTLIRLVASAIRIEEGRGLAISAVIRRDTILSSINYLATTLLTSLDEDAINDVLIRLLESLGVSRIYIAQIGVDPDKRSLITITHEQVAEKRLARMNPELTTNIPWIEAGYERWATLLINDQIVSGPVSLFPVTERNLLLTTGVLTFVAVPIMVNNHFYGFIGFDQCTSERMLSGPEEEALRTASKLIGAALVRGEMERSLVEQEENFRLLFNTIDDLLFILDSRGVIITVNATACSTLGYIRSDLQGLHFSFLCAEDDTEEFRSAFTNLDIGGMLPIHISLKQNPGTLIPVEARLIHGAWSGQDVVIGICKNITGILESEEKFFRVFHSNPAMIGILSADSGRFFEVNPATLSILGYSEDDILGRTPIELGFFLDPYEWERSLLDLHTHMTVGSHDIRFTTSSGKTRVGSYSCELITIAGRLCYLWIVMDITTRKMAEEQSQKLLCDLEMKNQELQDFAYIISHDLKAPLRGITSLSEWLVTDYQDRLDESGVELLTLIQSRVSRMQLLIDGILSYSRAGRLLEEKEPVDCSVIIQEAIDNISPPRGITIQIDSPLPVVFAERTKILQIFQNLIGNAVKYMGRDEGHILIQGMPGRGWWTMKIQDDGPGIDPKHHERIFQIFQSLSPSEDGQSSGIGLTIVKKIIETYGGTITLKSEPGVGSEFIFTLPISDQGPEQTKWTEGAGEE
ncbi:MAG TPA: PAS domain S-box protein [Methanospirillum sp.]|nr:PAS domain S-box protein [Methanospirillum sp.]